MALLAALFALALGPPAGARWFAQRVAAQRGVHLSIGGVSFDWGGVTFRDVVAATDGVANGAPLLDVRASTLRLDARLVSLLSAGRDAVRGLEVAGCSVRVRVKDSADGSALRRVLLGSDASGRGEDAVGARRTVRIRNCGVVLEDGEGELVVLERANAQLGETIDFDVVGIASGGPSGPSVRAVAASASAVRSTGAWRLARMRVESLGGVWSADANGPSGLISRWRRLRHALNPRDAGAPVSAGGLLAFVRERFDESFSAEVVGATLRVIGAQGAESLDWRDIEVSVARQAGDAWTTRGAALAGGSSRVQWNLVAELDPLVARGTVRLDAVSMQALAPLFVGTPVFEPERATVSGELQLVGASATQVDARVRVRIDDLAMQSVRLASEPVRDIDLGLDALARWEPIAGVLTVAEATVTLGGARVAVRGRLERQRGATHLMLDASLPPTPCTAALRAIPRGLLGDVAGFSLDGAIAGAVRIDVDSRALDRAILEVSVRDACAFSLIPGIADVGRFEGPFVHRVTEPDGTVFEMMTGPGTEAWTELEDIHPFLVHAVLAHEDAAFFRHRGFAPAEIQTAFRRNLVAGRYVQGASTITMQLVKNVFLHREKTLARKLQEVVLTWWLESMLDKSSILELYLNVIEYGPGIYGIRNAARTYFGVEPASLSLAEAAFLATILPNPKAYAAQLEAGRPSRAVIERTKRFLGLVHERGRVDRVAYDAAIADAEGLRFHPRGAPLRTPAVHPGSASELPFTSRGNAMWDDVEPPAENDRGGF